MVIYLERRLGRNYYEEERYSSARTYLNLTYYDLSFLINSIHLNIKEEAVALQAVYRYGIKVISDSGVTSRLIKGIRFSYLELGEILNVAHSNLKLFAKSPEFQKKLSDEIERRMKCSHQGNNDSIETPRLRYADSNIEVPRGVAEEITSWLVKSQTNGRQERMIRRLKYELEREFEDKNKRRRKYEDDVEEILNNQKIVRGKNSR